MRSCAEVDSFHLECKGCAKMKGQEVEMEQLRQICVALVGREEVGCASGSGGGTVDDKVGEGDEKDARESSPQPGIRLRGVKVTRRKEIGRNETGPKEMGRKTVRDGGDGMDGDMSEGDGRE